MEARGRTGTVGQPAQHGGTRSASRARLGCASAASAAGSPASLQPASRPASASARLPRRRRCQWPSPARADWRRRWVACDAALLPARLPAGGSRPAAADRLPSGGCRRPRAWPQGPAHLGSLLQAIARLSHAAVQHQLGHADFPHGVRCLLVGLRLERGGGGGAGPAADGAGRRHAAHMPVSTCPPRPGLTTMAPRAPLLRLRRKEGLAMSLPALEGMPDRPGQASLCAGACGQPGRSGSP
jgi:hypothetical protein